MKNNLGLYLFMFMWPLLVVGVVIIWQWNFLKAEFGEMKQTMANLGQNESLDNENEGEVSTDIAEVKNETVTGEKITNENGNVYEFKTVEDKSRQLQAMESTRKKLAEDGYTIWLQDDINQDGSVEIAAYKKEEVLPSAEDFKDIDWDYLVASDLVIYTYMGGNLPDVVLKIDKYNAQWEEDVNKKIYFILGYFEDPFGNMRFSLTPIDGQGRAVSQGASLLWDPFLGRYEMYCCGR